MLNSVNKANSALNFAEMKNNMVAAIRLRHIVFAGLCLLYIVPMYIMSSHLWYWFDEWTILRSQESEYLGLLQGHFGNFFPLGRLVFWVEVQVFGNFYPGLVLVNSVLVLITLYLVWRIVSLRQSLNLWQQIVSIAGLTIFATAAGVQFDVLWGFQVCWLLSVFFVVLGPYLVQRESIKPLTSLSFVVLSWLSMGSNVIPSTLLYLALMFLIKRRPLKFGWIINFLVLSAAALVLTLTGVIIARLNPSVEPLAQPSGVQLPGSLADVAAGMGEVLAGSILWLITPVSLLLGTRPNVLEEYGPILAVSPILIHLSLLILIALFLVLTGIKEKRSLIAPSTFLLSLVALICLVAFRGQDDFDSTFDLRYAPSALLPVTIFWILIVTSVTAANRKISRVTVGVVGIALIATAVTGTLVLIFSQSSQLVIFGRDHQANQLELLRNCQSEGYSGIESAPFQSFTSEDFCNLYSKLANVSDGK